MHVSTTLIHGMLSRKYKSRIAKPIATESHLMLYATAFHPVCASFFSITTPGKASVYSTVSLCCSLLRFYSKQPPSYPPPPDTHRLPPHIKPCTNTHCTSACWVMLTGCAGCLCENWRGVLGQWARARFLLTQAMSCIHVSYLWRGFFFEDINCLFFFSPWSVCSRQVSIQHV